MLVRYKKNLEKIAMGLLSFMPEEKDVKKLQETIKEYNTNPDWHLYLWKEDEDILGAIGVRIENELNAVVQHISVNPSNRGNGIGQKMIQTVKQQYGDKYAVCADEDTQNFYNKTENNIDGNDTAQ